MEFLKKNYLNTTTMIDVGSGTDTVQYLFDNNTLLQYGTDNFNDDTTIATLTINFDETTTIDKIILSNHNLKSFTIFYNGVTANTFVLTNPTTISDFITNSATSLYLDVTSVDCTSVTIDMKTTIVANSEKAIGSFILSEQEISFDRNPASSGYKPTIKPTQYKHTLSDGGTRTHTVSKKYSSKISLKYVSQSFKDELKAFYDNFEDFIFVPFGTGTSWDGFFYPVVWTGSFNFDEYSDDVKSAGFDGKIVLEETPK